jgi:hypothetical protein
VFLGEADGAFMPPITITAPANTFGLAAGDFNNDGILDLVTSTALSQFDVFLGNGDGTFTLKFTGNAGFSSGAIAVADFNGDGKLDVAVGNYFGAVVDILLGNGDGTFTPGVNAPVGHGANSVVTGDFNNDGIPDLIAVNADDSTASVLLGKGDGTFTTSATLGVVGLPGLTAIGDFNQDGKADLAVSNTQTVTVYLGNGDGTFGPRVDYPASNVVNPVVVDLTTMPAVDLNGDGFLDIVVPCGPIVSVLPGNGDGTFGTPLHYEVQAQGVATGQFRNDDGVDLAAAVNSDHPAVLLNKPLIALFPSAIDFGRVSAGQHKSVAVSVSNPSGGSLKVGIIAVSGSSTFSQRNNCDGSISPGGECTVQVTFAPTAHGRQTGTLEIPSNVAGGVRQIPLSGTGR